MSLTRSTLMKKFLFPNKILLRSVSSVETITAEPIKKSKEPHKKTIDRYFASDKHLSDVRPCIPEKYFKQKRRTSVQNLYLIDTKISKNIVSHILPNLKSNPNQAICDTNTGLGLIAAELLDNGIEIVRLYELCPEFRQSLKDFRRVYRSRVKIFIKDMYHLSRMAYVDKNDNGNRVTQLLHGVPKKDWSEDPVMTVIGPMPTLEFIKYLITRIGLQSEVLSYGRIQIYAIMRPSDFVILTAGPELNLHTYQSWSILFRLLFDYSLLEKYPRHAFLPWETKVNVSARTRYALKVDLDHLYLVRINFKAELPVAKEHLLHLHYFIKNCYGRGSEVIIPSVEKRLPGSAFNFFFPNTSDPKEYFENLNIYTKFGELNPTQILYLFKQLINHPEYNISSFTTSLDSTLLKSETVESDVAESREDNYIADELEEKFDESVE